MAEKYRFFDPVQDSNGQYDREYNAQEFTDYFGALITTGIMKGTLNELKVTTNGNSMVTTVDTGIAFLEGRYYENDSPLDLVHDTESLGKSRIDRIVIRLDLRTEARYVRAFVKKGTPSTNPVPPVLQRDNLVYEISLAQVRITGGQTYIATGAVTDERGTEDICPWAGSKILPNFNDDALEQLITDVDILNNKIEQKADKTSENWINATLLNSWIGTLNNPPKFFKDGFGDVHFKGVVTKGSSYIFRFPEGYRPKVVQEYPVFVVGGDIISGFVFKGISTFRVYTDGLTNFSVIYGSNDMYIFDGTFKTY